MTTSAKEAALQQEAEQVGYLYEDLLVSVESRTPNVVFGALAAVTSTCLLTCMIQGGVERTPENLQRFAERFGQQLLASLNRAAAIEAKGQELGESIIIL